MRHILAMTLAVLFSAGAVGAQDFDAGLEAANRGDFAAALKEWRPLADQGNADAQYNLGVMYNNGEGVPQDKAEAVRWFRLAAEQGIALAQYNLGIMYGKGEGVLQDNIQAHMHGNIACALGLESGCEIREIIAEDMTPADISEAYERALVCTQSFYEDCD